MSATLANIDDLLKYLDAQFYEERFRPVIRILIVDHVLHRSSQVELEEYVKINDTVYKIDRKNTTHLGELIEHRRLDFKVTNGQSEECSQRHRWSFIVLKTAFAQWSRSVGRSRWGVDRCFDRSFEQSCDTSVRSDSQRFVFGLLRVETELWKCCTINRELHARVSRTFGWIPRRVRLFFRMNLRKLLEDNREKRSILLESLVEVNEGNLCETLKATIPFGIAYHHSGLTGDGNA